VQFGTELDVVASPAEVAEQSLTDGASIAVIAILHVNVTKVHGALRR